MVTIQKVIGYEVLDSRGNPTVGATVQLSDGSLGTAAAPSGASTGTFEAVELRDGDARRYGGKGVKKAARNVTEVISPALEKLHSLTVREVDTVLQKLDGTPNKAHLGANATLAVSLAAARAMAAHYRMPLFRFLGGAGAHLLPTPMMNILNGGAHAGNNIDIQEFMVVPVGAESFREGLRWCAEITHTLGAQLKEKGLSAGVGDEGGFAPDLRSDEEAIEEVLTAIEKAGYTGKVKLALDAAASEWVQGDRYVLPKRGKVCAPEELAWLESRADRWASFTALWALKESRVKYTGRGLTVPIRSIAVPLPREGQTLLTRDGLRFRLYAGPGWRAAVCGRSEPPPSILWRDIPPKGGGPVDL